MHTYIHTYTHNTYTHIHIHTYIHTYIHTHTHTHTWYTHTHTHTHTWYTHIHTYIHTHTHTHIFIRVQQCSKVSEDSRTQHVQKSDNYYVIIKRKYEYVTLCSEPLFTWRSNVNQRSVKMNFKLRSAVHMSIYILGVKYITADSSWTFVLLPC